MCVIQAVYFMKNGSNLSAPCNAIITDKIETDVLITYDSSEVGKTVKAGITVLYPNGVKLQFRSANFVVPIAGSYDFIFTVEVVAFGVGTYKITNAETWDYNTGNTMCSGIFSGGFCQSLTVSDIAWDLIVTDIGNSFRFKSCAPLEGGYLYVLKPSGGLLGQVDIPKSGCRTDDINKSYFTESGTYIARVASYTGITQIEKTLVYNPNNKYKICQSNTCVEVTGTGIDTCSTVGAVCGTIDKHKTCDIITNKCTEVTGAGTDECITVGTDCTPGDGGGTDYTSTIILMLILAIITAGAYFVYTKTK